MVVAKPLLGQFDQAFQYIQEFTGFFTPGIVVIFVMGMFWSGATSNGALAAAIGSAVLSFLFRQFWPDLPFMDRVGLVFLLCFALCFVFSLMDKATQSNESVDLSEVSFATDKGFNLAALGVTLVLVALYTTWW